MTMGNMGAFRANSRLRRLLCVLAWLQVLVPAAASIADAWRLDQRTPYAHVEAPGTTGCPEVHAHDCALCTIATTPCARPAPAPSIPAAVAQVAAPASPRAPSLPSHERRVAPPRGPPSILA